MVSDFVRPCTTDEPRVALRSERIECPSVVQWFEYLQVIILVDDPSGMVEPPAAGCVLDLPVEHFKVIFDDLVKVDECLIGVVECLCGDGLLGKEDGRSASKGLRIDGVLWQDRQYDISEKILTPIRDS